MSLKLLLVDDSTHFLGAARALLEREGFLVVGVASTIAEALRRYDELDPDVTLVDIDLGDESGLDLVRRLSDAAGERSMRAILISAYPEEDVVDLLVSTPAVGFLSKSAISRGSIEALLSSADGGMPSEGR
jgi:DNA-binding NarL/FixJ family response regulator